MDKQLSYSPGYGWHKDLPLVTDCSHWFAPLLGQGSPEGSRVLEER